MKFDKRKAVLVGVIIAVALVAALWFGLRSRTVVTTQGRYDDLRPSTSPRPPQVHPAISPPVTAGAITTPVLEAERQKAIEHLEATSIVFFGKVVDQHDLPVVGARVTYTVHHLNFHGNPPIEGPLTDKMAGLKFEPMALRLPSPCVPSSILRRKGSRTTDRLRRHDNRTSVLAEIQRRKSNLVQTC